MGKCRLHTDADQEVETGLPPKKGGSGPLTDFWHDLVVLATTPVYLFTVLGATVYTGDSFLHLPCPLSHFVLQQGCIPFTSIPFLFTGVLEG